MKKVLAALAAAVAVFVPAKAMSEATSRTYDGGRTWYNSDGSSSRTYDGGNTHYHSDGSTSRTYDGGNTWYHDGP